MAFGRFARGIWTSSNVIWKLPWRAPRPPAARVPDGLRIYAIGDVHGRADVLADTFARIDADLANCQVAKPVHVFLGDYVDRGPASRKVLDLLIARGCCFPAVYLKGNHESYFMDFLKNPAVFANWRSYGGLETLLSYGLAPPVAPDQEECAALASNLGRVLPDMHRRFLDNLQLSFTCGDFFFVHAGVRPNVAFANQREEDLLWIREEFLLHEGAYEKLVVHGHTPVREPDIRPNRINIDTGAYATGRLTCLILEGSQLRFI